MKTAVIFAVVEGGFTATTVQEVYKHGSYLSAQEASALQGAWFP